MKKIDTQINIVTSFGVASRWLVRAPIYRSQGVARSLLLLGCLMLSPVAVLAAPPTAPAQSSSSHPNVSGVSPTIATRGTSTAFTITGSNLPSTIVGNIEGTPGHCKHVSGSGDRVVLDCNASLTGHKRFYLSLTPGGAPIAGSKTLYIDVAD